MRSFRLSVSALFLGGAFALALPVAAQAGTQARPTPPQSVLVAATPDAAGDIKIEMTALPVLTGCGKMSPLPTNVVYDQYAVDVYVGDPAFFVPFGSGPKDCGPASKAAFKALTLSSADLEKNDVRLIRFWYRQVLDTYPLHRSAEGVSVSVPAKPTFFKPDTRRKALR